VNKALNKITMLERQQKRYRRHKRVRAKVKGTAEVPRLCIFRSNKYIYAQLINDDKNKILVSVSGKFKESKKIGKEIAKKATDSKIKKIVFDRGGYKYHGRVKELAEGAREGGLQF
jgi:large subunit ribosomal protein L18